MSEANTMRATRARATSQGKGKPRARDVALALLIVGIIAASLLGVVSGNFALSFAASRQVALAAHAAPGVAWLLPIGLDGAMMVAALAMLLLRHWERKAGYPLAVVVIGTALSVTINGVHAMGDGPTLTLAPAVRFCISAVPPAMLALVFHLIQVLIVAFTQRRAEIAEIAARAEAAEVAREAELASMRRQAALAEATHEAELASLRATAEAALQAAARATTTPELPSTVEGNIAPEAIALKMPRASKPRAISAVQGKQGNDELALRREGHAYDALVAWWSSVEGKEACNAPRRNGWPNRAEAKAIALQYACGSSAVADRLIARLKAAQGNGTPVPDAL